MRGPEKERGSQDQAVACLQILDSSRRVDGHDDIGKTELVLALVGGSDMQIDDSPVWRGA